MLKHILSKLENIKQPLLGPNVKALKFWGVLLPANKFKKCFYILLHASVFLFTFTEFLDILFITNNLTVLLTNIKITLLATISCCKIFTFLIWQRHWKDIIEYVTRRDLASRNSRDEIDKCIIKLYTRYSRKVTYLYWSLMFTTNIFVIVQPIQKYFSTPQYRANVRNGTEPLGQVVSSYVPWDKTTVPGFLGASAYQIFAAMYGGGWITSYDTNAMVIMVFFRGELELLKRSCSKIYSDKKCEVMPRIKECHKRHVELVKYASLYNSLLSPAMLLYVIVSSIMLCASIYETSMESDPVKRLLIGEYLIFGVSQIFLYCWHGNDVTLMSNEVMRGVYESDWWKYNVHRRELLLLTGQLDTKISFSAGPFLQLNIATFVNILKGAYSYYTLIK